MSDLQRTVDDLVDMLIDPSPLDDFEETLALRAEGLGMHPDDLRDLVDDEHVAIALSAETAAVTTDQRMAA